MQAQQRIALRMMQRTIRFLLASKAEESAINSARNAARAHRKPPPRRS